MTPEAFEKEKEIYRAQAAETGKPPAVIEKIVEGKMGKFYEEVCLYEQPFIKDQTMTVSQFIASVIGNLGENIAVKRFARFKVGDVGETVAVSKAAEAGSASRSPHHSFAQMGGTRSRPFLFLRAQVLIADNKAGPNWAAFLGPIPETCSRAT